MAKKILIYIMAFLAAASCGVNNSYEKIDAESLAGLDSYLSTRAVYETRKQNNIDGLRKLAESSRNPYSLYECCMQIADEYFSYSFDSTQFYLKKCLDLASDLRDKELYTKASIRLGHLYSKSGNYMEAYNRLVTQTDTTGISHDLQAEYLLALYEFSNDLAGNSGMVERPDLPEKEVYLDKLYEYLPRDSKSWRELRFDELMAAERLDSADSLGRIMLAGTRPEEHDYAIYAYKMSTVAEHKGEQAERLEWLVKSAESDIINSVKDYASLTMISQLLLPSDVEHSFRYLRIAQQDAIEYNAKLRPWQISQFFMGIEDAYSERRIRLQQAVVVGLVLLAVLTVLLLTLTWFLRGRSRKLAAMKEELEQRNESLALANDQLEELNRELSKADKVKEEYILDFLRKQSDNVSRVQSEDNYNRNMLKKGKAEQLLKELSLSTRTEQSLKEFYRNFDSTILQAICPDFVERFNELLREECRFNPKPGSLNTELRIFALIRLGVDDSKEIASLLHYSQSTIYNYKVAVKNAAISDRDNFEQKVKMIGK